MQTPQSNTAADLPQPRLQPRFQSPLRPGSQQPGSPSGSTSFLSPFSAPIQAARKYLERQRGGDSQGTFQQSDAESPDGEQAGADPVLRQPIASDQTSRNRDRRLERSLYEGHSIEAGLYFDELHMDEFGMIEDVEADPRNEGRETNEDSETNKGRVTPFPYADPSNSGPSYEAGPYAASLYAETGPASSSTPSPEAVRGAIFRLAREAGTQEAQTRAAEHGRSRPAEAAMNDSPADSEALAAAPPLAFAEVARRLWTAGSAAEERDYKPGEPLDNRTIAPIALAETQPTSATQAVTEGTTVSACAASHPTPPVEASISRIGCEGDVGNGFEEEPALAHDACNLLSALGLYSDLLGMPGVLTQEHRHYAEELNLVAKRSQVLVGRLLKLRTSREAETGRQPGPDNTLDTVSPTVATVTLSVTGSAGRSGPTPPVSLVDLLMRWGSLLSTLAQGTLEVTFGPDAATPVSVEVEDLERILINLVRNARAATVAGGAIRIGAGLVETEAPATAFGLFEANRHGHAMVLTVDDSGHGMTETQVRQLLGDATAPGTATTRSGQEEATRYYNFDEDLGGSLDRSKNQGGRQGLGVRIVRELVEASGGSLGIQSRLGRGTRIEMRWPVVSLTATGQPAGEAALPRSAPVLDSTGESGPKYLPEIAVVTAIGMAAEPPLTVESPASKTAAVGPDGFSEAELQTMMLRLHRTGPHRSALQVPAEEGAIAC